MGFLNALSDLFGSTKDSLIKSRQDINDGIADDHVRGPGKALLSDPLVWAFASQYYIEKPNTVNCSLLRYLSKRDLLTAVIHQTRIAQLSSFFSPRQHDEAERSVGTGFRVKLRTGAAKTRTKRVIKKEDELTQFINTCGKPDKDAEDTVDRQFSFFGKKFCRDSLEMDQACAEKQLTNGGYLHQFYAVDGATIRIKKPNYYDDGTKYVQIERGRVVAEFENEEFVFCPRNVSTDIYRYGYGLSELEIAVREISTNIGISLNNERILHPGAMPKGIMQIKNTELDARQIRELETSWKQQITTFKGRHRIPMISIPRGGELQLITFPQPTEMEYKAFIDHLSNMLCALYNMDPVEINMPNRSGAPGGSQALFSSANETARITHSKDKGLKPILSWLETCMNLEIMPYIEGAEDFEFVFVGLDNKSDQEKMDLSNKQVRAFKTVNEVRVENGLEEIEGSDIILDNTWLQAQQAQQQAEGAEEDEVPVEGEEETEEVPEESEEPEESWETVSGELEGDEGW